MNELASERCSIGAANARYSSGLDALAGLEEPGDVTHLTFGDVELRPQRARGGDPRGVIAQAVAAVVDPRPTASSASDARIPTATVTHNPRRYEIRHSRYRRRNYL